MNRYQFIAHALVEARVFTSFAVLSVFDFLRIVNETVALDERAISFEVTQIVQAYNEVADARATHKLDIHTIDTFETAASLFIGASANYDLSSAQAIVVEQRDAQPIFELIERAVAHASIDHIRALMCSLAISKCYTDSASSHTPHSSTHTSADASQLEAFAKSIVDRAARMLHIASSDVVNAIKAVDPDKVSDVHKSIVRVIDAVNS